jgi:hypothetical protein
VDALHASGSIINGELDELSAPTDYGTTDGSTITDADLLHEALLVISASPRSDPKADGGDFV